MEPVAPAFAAATRLAAGAARWRERAARGTVDPGVAEGRRGAGARGGRGEDGGRGRRGGVQPREARPTKELGKLFQLERVDPAVRDQHGLTLLHIAAQNNQRKAAKLVLKRTDLPRTRRGCRSSTRRRARVTRRCTLRSRTGTKTWESTC